MPRFLRRLLQFVLTAFLVVLGGAGGFLFAASRSGSPWVMSSTGVSFVPETRLVIAARDIEYCGPATPCGPGGRTDTIFYAEIKGGRVRLVSIPRDTLIETRSHRGRINAVYGESGPSGLALAVEELLGVEVDHYAILTLNSVASAVDAVGGIEVYLEAPMRYVDRAANLYIDFPAGQVHLDGEDAVKYMRFRGWAGSDLGRIARIQEVVLKTFARALTPTVWPRLPEAMAEVWQGVETDLDQSEALAFLPYVTNMSLEAVTLPVRPVGPYLVFDAKSQETFRRQFVQAPPVTFPPVARVTLRDGSGANLGPSYQERLARLGIGEVELVVSEPEAMSEIRVSDALAAGSYYAEALHLPMRSEYGLEEDEVAIVLGRDLIQ